MNLSDNVFRCFDGRRGKQGDAIDPWAAVPQPSRREAALDPVGTFEPEQVPPKATEKRHV